MHIYRLMYWFYDVFLVINLAPSNSLPALSQPPQSPFCPFCLPFFRPLAAASPFFQGRFAVGSLYLRSQGEPSHNLSQTTSHHSAETVALSGHPATAGIAPPSAIIGCNLNATAVKTSSILVKLIESDYNPHVPTISDWPKLSIFSSLK